MGFILLGGSGMREEKYSDMSLTDEQASLLGFKSFSEHEQYIQVKDTRYTLDEFNRIGKLLLGRELTDDQQVVLEWLKWSVEDQKNSPMDAVYLLILGEALTSVSLAYIALTNKEEAQVLRIFSAWTLEQEEE